MATIVPLKDEKLPPDGPKIKVHVAGFHMVPYLPEYHRGEYVEILLSEWQEYQMDQEKMLEWEQYAIQLRREQFNRMKQP